MHWEVVVKQALIPRTRATVEPDPPRAVHARLGLARIDHTEPAAVLVTGSMVSAVEASSILRSEMLS
jgi:hypothetical protein